ncbi:MULTISPECIES: DUF4265 domain-containing protein [Luteibacter]|uniref:DUF4265 domain-containing protein n=2 Tax=Rhodanobacteraceae TaxID=1775411 RepID=UPI00068A3AC4|nr:MULTISPECIES: DUF4265 domain-containing protein [unclassified Luteibacter]
MVNLPAETVTSIRATKSMPELVKVFFSIQPDEDGYPDVGSESVWARPAGSPDTYTIDNIPFFARQAGLGDTVRAPLQDGVRWFDRVLVESPNSLFRVVCFDENIVDAVADALRSLGCVTEYFKARNLLAVSVPGGDVLEAAEAYLNRQEGAGVLDFEGAIYRE